MSDRGLDRTTSASPTIVRETIDVAAPPALVFRALVDPHELATWLGGDDPRDASAPPGSVRDAHPGQSWHAPALAPDGVRGSVSGEYLVVDPPHCLESIWRASWNDFAPERVRFELVPIEVGGTEGTRVTVTHTRALTRLTVTLGATRTTARTAERTAGYETEHWAVILPRLAAHVAAAALVARWGTAPGGASTHWFDALHRAVVATHQGE